MRTKARNIIPTVICLVLLLAATPAFAANNHWGQAKGVVGTYATYTYTCLQAGETVTKLNQTNGTMPPGIAFSYKNATESDYGCEVTFFGTPTSSGVYDVEISVYGSYGGLETWDITFNIEDKKATPVPEIVVTPEATTSPEVPATPLTKPVITKNPTGETVTEGGSCSFIARADGTEKFEWFFISDNGKQYTEEEAKAVLSGLKIKGGDTEKIRLSHIPMEMDGWSVYCVFSNSVGSIESKQARIYVNEEPVETYYVTATPWMTDIPVETPEPTNTATPEPSPTVHIHSLSTEWQGDENGHYHICTICGEHVDNAAHEMEWTVIKTATSSEEGQRIGKCILCGYIVVEPVQYDATASGSNTGTILAIVTLAILICAVIALVVLLIKRR